MRRVTSLLPSWDYYKSDSKKIIDRSWSWKESSSSPNPPPIRPATLSVDEIKMLTESSAAISLESGSRKIDFESFWPSTLDKESEKAARILHSFCKDGFQVDLDNDPDAVSQCPPVFRVIPPRVLQAAVGLMIFKLIRAGLWISGAGGSGVLMARMNDGRWSSPSGLLLQTAGISFSDGVDAYDCIVVINDHKALNTFDNLRITIGNDVVASIGPLSDLEYDELSQDTHPPIFTYLSSRGFYAHQSLDLTTIIQRNDENKRFYGWHLSPSDILGGKTSHFSPEIKNLKEIIKAAENHLGTDLETNDKFVNQQTLGEIEVHSSPSPCFGIPGAEDPDPFGVIALERAGLEIRESGTGSLPSSTQFEFHPSPNSPVLWRLSRRSMDTITSRSNRGSCISTRTRASMDRATQTDDPPSPNTSPSYYSDNNQTIEEEHEDIHGTETELHDQSDFSNTPDEEKTKTNEMARFKSPANSISEPDQDATNHSSEIPVRVNPPEESLLEESDICIKDDLDALDLEDDEEPVIIEAPAQATTIMSTKNARGGLVNIPKRGPPPPLPVRSASRGVIDADTLRALGKRHEVIEVHEEKPQDRHSKRFSSRVYAPASHIPLPGLKEVLDKKKTLALGVLTS